MSEEPTYHQAELDAAKDIAAYEKDVCSKCMQVMCSPVETYDCILRTYMAQARSKKGLNT